MKSFTAVFSILFLPLILEACIEDPFSVFNPLAALFCDSNNIADCSFRNEPVEKELMHSTVVVSGHLRCSGIVVWLKKGANVCKTPLLLTSGHCVLSHEKPEDNKTIRANKVGAFIQIKQEHIRPLQKECVTPP